MARLATWKAPSLGFHGLPERDGHRTSQAARASPRELLSSGCPVVGEQAVWQNGYSWTSGRAAARESCFPGRADRGWWTRVKGSRAGLMVQWSITGKMSEAKTRPAAISVSCRDSIPLSMPPVPHHAPTLFATAVCSANHRRCRPFIANHNTGPSRSCRRSFSVAMSRHMSRHRDRSRSSLFSSRRRLSGLLRMTGVAYPRRSRTEKPSPSLGFRGSRLSVVHILLPVRC